jgi:hypothetical protein
MWHAACYLEEPRCYIFFGIIARQKLQGLNAPEVGALGEGAKWQRKPAKKTTSKSENSHPLRLSCLFLASLRWAFDFSFYCFGVKTYPLLFWL